MLLANGRANVVVEADPNDAAGLWATFTLDNIAHLSDAIARVRRLFDLDADPLHVNETLRTDPIVATLVDRRPGIRIPGSTCGFEAAVSAVVGQQISVAGARTLLGRLHEANDGAGFPNPGELLELDLDSVGLTSARQRTLQALAEAVTADEVVLDVVADRTETRARLLAIPGIGPWTADIIAMRALGDTDVLLATDLVIRRRLDALGVVDTEHLAPWRSYVACTLWATREDTP